jgi:hypothetical protein
MFGERFPFGERFAERGPGSRFCGAAIRACVPELRRKSTMIERMVLNGCLVAGLSALGFVNGCSRSATVVDASTRINVASSENLDVTVDYLFSDEQFAMNELEEKVSGGLSRWISAEQAAFDQFTWEPDPLVATLPEAVAPLVEYLDGETFVGLDAHYLQGQIWFKEIADTVAQGPLARHFWPPLSKKIDEFAQTESRDNALIAALKFAHPELDDAHAGQLAEACKLFDWTIRNILLMPRRDWPTDETIDREYLIELEEPWPPSAGVRGPGYQRFNWQLLTYGRGDDLERCRVFAQLAQMRDLDVVLLAFPSATPSSAPNEALTVWVSALLLGDQLYLFDTRLGLPIPGKENGRIATLADVKQDPSLIKSLDLTVAESTSDASKYWLDAAMLEQPVIALIDAPLESMTKRMAFLERSLTGRKRIRCAQNPSDLAARLADHPLIQETRLLSAELYVHQFRDAVSQGFDKMRYNSDIVERLTWFFSDEEYVDNYVRLRTAKNQYFLDRIESSRGVKDKGALELFSTMVVVYTDDLIDKLQNHPNVLHALGLQREGIPALEYQQRLASIQSHMRLVRGDATYFLALCFLQQENPSAALVWLARVPVLDNRGFWKNGTTYLTGRAHEMLNDITPAIELYRIGRNDAKLTPQAHGNLIRARLLQPLVNGGAVAATSQAADAQETTSKR